MPSSVLSSLDAVTSAVGGEERPGQRQMASAVADAIESSSPLVVEAGTGIGKSLAYLVPVALSRKPTVIATATKALQDQLRDKDIPALERAGIRVTSAVLKGRLNYLCRKKLADPAPADLSAPDRSLRATIAAWATTTMTGERDELDEEPSPRLWTSLSMSADECPGADRCPFGASCFAEQAKRRAADSDIVVVNSALYGAHLSTGRTLLPPHDVVVFDEAHELPDILSRSLGAELSAPRVRAAATLAHSVSEPSLRDPITALSRAADALGDALLAQAEEGPVGVGSALNAALVDVELAAEALQQALESLSGLSGSAEMSRLSSRGVLVHLRYDLERFLVPNPRDLIFIEGAVRHTLICAPVEVGPLLADLWKKVTPVLTSATIPPYLSSRLGLAESSELVVPSPFDYASQSVLYLPELGSRRTDTAERMIADELTALISAAGGRTMALFTSHRALSAVGTAVRARLSTPVLIQGEAPRAALLREFIRNESASIFATMGFWQGVDVPGRTLSLLTIDRLPFGRPDDPMLQARRELAGPRAFYTVDLPRTATLLTQGVGRLIRSRTDRGVVAVFDDRLLHASYREALLDRLPPMRRTSDRQEAIDFLNAE